MTLLKDTNRERVRRKLVFKYNILKARSLRNLQCDNNRTLGRKIDRNQTFQVQKTINLAIILTKKNTVGTMC